MFPAMRLKQDVHTGDMTQKNCLVSTERLGTGVSVTNEELKEKVKDFHERMLEEWAKHDEPEDYPPQFLAAQLTGSSIYYSLSTTFASVEN